MSVLKKLVPIDDLRATINRFPGSALCSFVLFAIVVLSIHKVVDLDKNVMSRVVAILVSGFFWFGFARLVAEGKGWAAKLERLLGYAGFFLIAVLVFLFSGTTLVWLLALMIPALLLGISVGPYISSNDDLSFWFYNRQVWQGAAVSFLASLLWWGGLSAAFAAVTYLFSLPIPKEMYGDLWAFSATVFGPLYALSWVPEKYSYTEDDCHAPPQLSFTLNWVLAPLVVIYLLILYAYFIKIAIVGELPRGQLSYMVTAFGGVGVMTYLSGWPLREQGGPMLRLVYKLFFPALFIPVAMQAVSIYLRLDQYGVTEQRYLVALSTVWFAFLAIGYTFKKLSLKWIAGVLAVMMMVAALGPLSASNVAQKSQLNRLERLLVDNSILVDGVITKAPEKPSFEDRKSISSILDFLRSRKKMDLIEGWVSEDVKAKPEFKEFDLRAPVKLTEMMGFEHVNSYQRRQDRKSENVNLNAPRYGRVENVSGYMFFMNQQRVQVYQPNRKIDDKRYWTFKDNNNAGFVAYYEDGQLFVGLENSGVVSFDIEEFALAEFKRDSSHEKREMILEKFENGLRVKVILQNINLRRELDQNEEEAEFYLNSFSFRALVGKS